MHIMQKKLQMGLALTQTTESVKIGSSLSSFTGKTNANASIPFEDMNFEKGESFLQKNLTNPGFLKYLQDCFRFYDTTKQIVPKTSSPSEGPGNTSPNPDTLTSPVARNGSNNDGVGQGPSTSETSPTDTIDNDDIGMVMENEIKVDITHIANAEPDRIGILGYGGHEYEQIRVVAKISFGGYQWESSNLVPADCTIAAFKANLFDFEVEEILAENIDEELSLTCKNINIVQALAKKSNESDLVKTLLKA